MSQVGVGIVMDKLLTDEDLRIRFALDQAPSGEAILTQLIDDIIALLAQRETRR